MASYIEDILLAMEQGDLEGALGLIEVNEAAHGEEADFFSVKAMLCIETGELETATRILLDGRTLHPRDGDILYNLGYLSEQLGDINAAYWLYFEAAQYIADEALREDAMVRCAALESNPLFNAHREAVLTTYSKSDLRAIDYSRDPAKEGDIYYLMRRIEFNADKKRSVSLVKTARGRGQVSKEWLLAYAMRTSAHQQQLLKLIETEL